MAKLTSSERNALPASDFALPKERKYPMEDKSHAANAKSRAAGQEGKGKISKATESKIDAKADRVLGNKSARGVGMKHANVKNASSHHDKLKHG